jgi:hypothetical protein
VRHDPILRVATRAAIGSNDAVGLHGQPLDSIMFTRNLLFGMNILTLVGFIMMGVGLTMRQMANAGLPLCFGLMGAGTVLVLISLYVSG